MNAVISTLSIAILTLAASTLFGAQVAFDNFGPNDGLHDLGGWFGSSIEADVPKYELAVRIVPVIEGDLTSIVAAIAPVRRNDADSILQLTIHSEIHGGPSDEILWQETYGPVVATGRISTFQVTEPFRLEPSVPVWLSAAELTTQWRPFAWAFSSRASGTSAIRGGNVLPPGKWKIHSPGVDTYAVRMHVIPEPTALTLLCVGPVGLLRRRWTDAAR